MTSNSLGPTASFMQRKLQKLWQLRLARLQSLLLPRQFFLLRLAAVYLHQPRGIVPVAQQPSWHGFKQWQPDNEQLRLYSALHQGQRPESNHSQHLQGLWLAQSPSGWLNPKGVFKFWLFAQAGASEAQQRQLADYCQHLVSLAKEQQMQWHFDIIYADAEGHYLLPRLWPDSRKSLLDGICLAGLQPDWFYLDHSDIDHSNLLAAQEGPRALQLAQWVRHQLSASLDHPLKSPPWLAEALLLLRHYPDDYLDASRRRQEIQTQPAEKLLDIGFHFAKQLTQDLSKHRSIISDACYLAIGIRTSEPPSTLDWRTLMARQWANQLQFTHKHRHFLDHPDQWSISDCLNWQHSLFKLWHDCLQGLDHFTTQQQLPQADTQALQARVLSHQQSDQLLPGLQQQHAQSEQQLLAYADGWRWMTAEGSSEQSQPFLKLVIEAHLQGELSQGLPACTPQAPISSSHWQQLIECLDHWLIGQSPSLLILIDQGSLSALVQLERHALGPRLSLIDHDELDHQGLDGVLTSEQPLVCIGQSERCQWWPLYQQAAQRQAHPYGRWLTGSGLAIQLLNRHPRGIDQHRVEDQNSLLELLCQGQQQWQPLFFSTHARHKWPQLAALYLDHQPGKIRVLLHHCQGHQLGVWVLDELGALACYKSCSQAAETGLAQLLGFIERNAPGPLRQQPLQQWLSLYQMQVQRGVQSLQALPLPETNSHTDQLCLEPYYPGQTGSSALGQYFLDQKHQHTSWLIQRLQASSDAN